MLRFDSFKIAVPHQHSKVRIFAYLQLLNTIGLSSFMTIFPLILADTLKNQEIIGYYYSAIAVLLFISSILSTVIFQKYSKVKIFKTVLLISMVVLLGMTVADNVWQIGGLDIPRSICVLFSSISLSLFVHQFTKKEKLAVEESRFFLFSNIGWLIGPILGGYLSKYYGNGSVFLVSSIAYLITFVIFNHQQLVLKHELITHDTHYESNHTLFKNILSYFKDPELTKVFLVSLGLNFWICIKFIYIPLMVINLGFEKNIIGFVIAGGIVPLVLLEYQVGKLAKKNGVKKYITFGFLLLSLMTLLVPFIDTFPKLLILVFLSLTNLGISFIEPLQATYFFESVKKADAEKYYGIYNTSYPVAKIIAPILASIVFGIFGSINGVWFLCSAVFIVFTCIALLIKEKTIRKVTP